MLESDVVLQAKRADRRNRIADAAARADHAGSASRKSAARPQGSEWLGHVCPVIAVFMEAWREGLADDERILLAPLRLKIAYTRATPRIAEQRGLMAADWLVRTYAPVWLNLAGLREQSRLLYGLPEITEIAHAAEIRAVLAKVSHDANAEALGVDEASWIKASDDCWASAWAAAFEAARLAADDPAWVSAAAASRAAAGLAARSTTRSFRAALQSSAAELVVRMARLGARPR